MLHRPEPLWTPPPGFLAEQYLRDRRRQERELFKRIYDPRIPVRPHPPLQCGIALAQAWVVNRQASGTTNNPSITTSAGSLIIIVILNEFTSISNTSFTVTDSNSAAYTQAEKSGTGQFQSYIYYRENAAAVTSVSVTNANTGTYTILVGEFSGAATSSSLDGHGNNSGTSTTPTVPATTITTTDLDVIVAGYVGNQTQASITDPTGYTNISHGSSSQDYGGAYRISAAGTYSAQWTVATGTAWLAVIASFKPAAAGAGVTLPQLMRSACGRSMTRGFGKRA